MDATTQAFSALSLNLAHDSLRVFRQLLLAFVLLLSAFSLALLEKDITMAGQEAANFRFGNIKRDFFSGF